MNQPLILEEVSHQYSTATHALREVSLHVPAEQVLGLVGRNGAGKSTLLQVALGLLVPTAGRVKVWGVDPSVDPVACKSSLGYVNESDAEFKTARIGELLALYRCLYPRWDEQLAHRLLGPLEASPRRKLSDLSRGQARRVRLACAMAHRPPLLVLDEPAGGLDPSMRRDFLHNAIELLSDAGTTLVLASHHLADIERIASRLVVLDEGRIRLDIAPEDVSAEFCLVHFALSNSEEERTSQWAALSEALAGLAGFVRLRRVLHGAQAVFRAPVGAVEARVLPLDESAICAVPTLEDLFSALVGDVQ